MNKTLILLIATALVLPARVIRVEIHSRRDVLDGKPFGSAGSYERLDGRVYFSAAVENPHNVRVVDIRNAVNLTNGEVEFSSDFMAIRPKDASRGNGSMILEVPNRGKSRILAIVDGGDWNAAANVGDAWLLRNGYTLVSIGWQWDAAGPDALQFHAPVAKENGKTISGLLRGDVTLSETKDAIPLGHFISGGIGGAEYPVSDPNDLRNTLTVRDSRDAPRMLVPRSQWQFAGDRSIRLNGGFQPGKIYEYVYAVSDPVVAGLGFAAVRDFASYAKYGPDAIVKATRVIGEGISQNGRFLRDYLYEGFNADEQGRQALDGVLAHVAGAGRGSFNYRFAQPSRDAQPTSSIFFPTDIFPFTDLPETDPFGGQRAGLLDHAAADKVVPKIFLSNTSYEYWGRCAALIHTTADGLRDMPLSDSVRIYHFTGLQHFSGPWPPVKGAKDLAGQQPQSPLPVSFFWRAMIANMDAWIRGEREPPESRYPTIADSTLVPLASYAFPKIPGVNKPHEANEAVRVDYGPNWQLGILSVQPPRTGKAFPVLVPQVDADGNERDGVRLPEIAIPLASYTGWNLRDASIGAPEQRVAFEGSYLPFPKTVAERLKNGDPRKSISERYPSRAEYLSRYGQVIDDLVHQHWILQQDRAILLHRGEQEWDYATK